MDDCYVIIENVTSQISNNLPSARRGHSLTTLGDEIYLFGGDSDGRPRSDFYKFSFQSMLFT